MNFRLRKLKDLKIKFVTNTTKESKNQLHKLLNSLGYTIEKHEIFTSLTAAYNLVQEQKLRPMLFLEQSALEDFHGIFLLRTCHECLQILKILFYDQDVNTEDPNAVVIGLAPSKFDYDHLNDAFK